VSVVVFFLAYLTGDPTSLLLPADASQEDIAIFRHQRGLDQPLVVQYWTFISGALTGHFGRSLMQGEDSMRLVLERVVPSLLLAMTSMVLSLAIALPLGILTAIRRGTWVDQLGRAVAMFGQSVPNFFVGLMLILLVSVKLGLAPATGGMTPSGLWLPALTLALYAASETIRLLRSSMLDVLELDYVRTARAKGLMEISVIVHHALRNAWIPVVTVLGLQFGSLMGRAVVTETVFAYPGMGMLAYRAIANRDFLVIQAFVIVMASLVVLANLFVDILYARIDPRIRERIGARS
jgi:peptide/nickel transport system permease protein